MIKKILILGVTGQDGSLLAEYLAQKGYQVFGLIRKSSNRNYDNIKKVINKKNFQLVQGDLLDPVSIENIIRKIKPQEIYNFADQDHVRWSSQIPIYSFDITARSVFNILNLIKIHSPKSKYFSEIIITKDLSSRNELIIDKSDVFIALPGGIGTLNEILEVINKNLLNEINKKIYLINDNLFWTPLEELFKSLIKKKLLDQKKLKKN